MIQVMLILAVIIFILYIVARILIPILTVILKMFALITLASPYILFIGIGLLIGLNINEFRRSR